MEALATHLEALATHLEAPAFHLEATEAPANHLEEAMEAPAIHLELMKVHHLVKAPPAML